MSEPSYNYWAFVSYCNRDAASARWLQRALEAYSVPRCLIGRVTPAGPAPKRFRPIFRDRSELPADEDLRARIDKALSQSAYLIVLCSPAAAASHWVNDEITSFRSQHGAGRIFAIIAAGTEGADVKGCFPPALFVSGCDDATNREPIAADLRRGVDGRHLALMKLVAGMLGVGLDELVQRDRQRRNRTLVAATVASVAGMAIMAGLATSAWVARNEAERQRGHAEVLIEFMLTDLRKTLEPSGRLDAMDGVGREALRYYSSQRPGDLDAQGLARQARALRLMGEIRVQRGDLSDALTVFEQAAAATGELLDRTPDDGQLIFNHAQNIFWVGEVARQRGDKTKAEESFERYRRLAEQLSASDPNNDDWRAEVAYADSALGVLFLDNGRAAEAVPAFARSLAVDTVLAERHPTDLNAQVNLGQGHAWLADALQKRGHLADARRHRDIELSIYRAVLRVDPTLRQAKFSMIIALQTLGQLQVLKNDQAEALANFGDAASSAEALLATERDNMDLTAVAANGQVELGETLLATGQISAARTAQHSADMLLGAALAHDQTVALWRDYSHRAALLEAAIAAKRNELERASQIARSVLHSLEPTAEISINTDPFWILQRCHLQLGDALAGLGQNDDARREWAAVMNSLTLPLGDIEPKLLVVLSAAESRLGLVREASEVTQYVASVSVETREL